MQQVLQSIGKVFKDLKKMMALVDGGARRSTALQPTAHEMMNDVNQSIYEFEQLKLHNMSKIDVDKSLYVNG